MTASKKASDYPVTLFRSLDELCSLIDAATKGWDTKWFRGVKSPTYTLTPKLFRDPSLSKREGYLSVEFRRRARSHIATLNSPFDWLCSAQHYGIPTRLLDWTESLAVALYFTVRPLELGIPKPTIWVLDPFELHRLTFEDVATIPIAQDANVDANVIANADIAFCDDYESTQKNRTKYPMPVTPDFLFTRLAMQNGAFTIHGLDESPIEAIIPKSKRAMLHKFVADDAALDQIFTSLDLLIPSSDALFPDIDGIKEYII